MSLVHLVVTEIVQQCHKKGIAVTDTLATFIARTVVEETSGLFQLDQHITHDNIVDIIARSVNKLTVPDDPSVETIKMQVCFAEAFSEEYEAITSRTAKRSKLSHEKRLEIADLMPKSANDFDTLTEIHRKIFELILGEQSYDKEIDRDLERETAVALESVFPRIGLRPFVNLTQQSKFDQIEELNRIILGIRMYNGSMGKGGYGLANLVEETRRHITTLSTDISKEVQLASNQTEHYQAWIIHLHAQPSDPLANEEMKSRLASELTNKRQLFMFLGVMQNEARNLESQIRQEGSALESEMERLKLVVGSKAAVSKAVVYPRFESVARVYLKLIPLLDEITARCHIFEKLMRYKSSFASRLPLEVPSTIDVSHGTERKRTPLMSAASSKQIIGQALQEAISQYAVIDSDGVHEVDLTEAEVADVAISDDQPLVETNVQETANEIHAMADHLLDDRIKILFPSTTADYLQIPLDFQGFCSVSLIEKGIVIPGKPSLGVIQFEDYNFVCSDEDSFKLFCMRPVYYIEAVKAQAVLHPEYIHLFNLQGFFPKQSLDRIMAVESVVATPSTRKQARKKDLSTETPLHFQDKFIDCNYSWNEWELRRRALAVVKLHNCATSSSQTDESHFRRDNTSQVFLPRDQYAQTKLDASCNTEKTVSYLSGLRGVPDANSKFMGKDKTRMAGARVVQMTFDV